MTGFLSRGSTFSAIIATMNLVLMAAIANDGTTATSTTSPVAGTTSSELTTAKPVFKLPLVTTDRVTTTPITTTATTTQSTMSPFKTTPTKRLSSPSSTASSVYNATLLAVILASSTHLSTGTSLSTASTSTPGTPTTPFATTPLGGVSSVTPPTTFSFTTGGIKLNLTTSTPSSSTSVPVTSSPTTTTEETTTPTPTPTTTTVKSAFTRPYKRYHAATTSTRPPASDLKTQGTPHPMLPLPSHLVAPSNGVEGHLPVPTSRDYKPDMNMTMYTPSLQAPEVYNNPAASLFVTENNTEVVAQSGFNAMVPCLVRGSGDGVTVNWMRRNDYHLLTVGLTTYSSDDRFQAIHANSPEDWTLKIKFVQPRDAGIYECQLSTHPPSSIFIKLVVVEARAVIPGPPEKFINSGSTLRLVCEYKESTEAPNYVFWYQGQRMINYDPNFGVITDRYTSTLVLQSVQRTDGGNYSCMPHNAYPASTFVHIINGENPAAMQHGSHSTCCVPCPPLWFLSFLLSITLQTCYFHFVTQGHSHKLPANVQEIERRRRSLCPTSSSGTTTLDELQTSKSVALEDALDSPVSKDSGILCR